ncbi:SCO-spondin [Manis javanica]|nr:SCO-spondin [Manis javanica]
MTSPIFSFLPAQSLAQCLAPAEHVLVDLLNVTWSSHCGWAPEDQSQGPSGKNFGFKLSSSGATSPSSGQERTGGLVGAGKTARPGGVEVCCLLVRGPARDEESAAQRGGAEFGRTEEARVNRPQELPAVWKRNTAEGEAKPGPGPVGAASQRVPESALGAQFPLHAADGGDSVRGQGPFSTGPH